MYRTCRINKHKKGMTLVELVVGLAVLSLATALLYMIYATGLKQFNSESATIDNQYNIRQAMSYIGREIRRADLIRVANNQLELTYLDVNNNVEEITYYYLSDNTIYKRSNGVANPLVEGITEFTYTIDGKNIKLVITSLPNAMGKDISVTSIIRIRE
ncbi:MAG TPA: competence type IV pilus minor pilin ComGF [Candidatus Atribacteria bacterium]|nr:competence type IV pilus minor pilin ComGF [Candidatus Atribacteria bacterium]